MDSPRRDGRAASVATDDATLVSRARLVPDASLLPFLRTRSPPRIAWRDRAGTAFVGAGAAATLTADGVDRFAAIRAGGAELFDAADRRGVPEPARPRLFGGFAFESTHDPAPPWSGFSGAHFVLPAVQVARVDGETWITASAVGPDAGPATVERALDDACAALEAAESAERGRGPGVDATRRTTSRDEWASQVATAVERMRSGDLEKVALAQSLSATLERPVDPAAVVERLGDAYPDCYRFLVEPSADAAFVGATPERLVSLDGGSVGVDALAGTVGRGETPAADAALAESLVDSEKIQEEHRLVVAEIRAQLSQLVESASVGDQRVRKLANVQHLDTPVSATAPEGTHVLSLVEALHPTPAVGGRPPEAALRTIRETETFDRGWYAAPVGWFDAAGDGAFAVGIRSAVLSDRTATLFAGNGLVAGSDPGEEWDEVVLKYRPILDRLEAE